MEIIYVYMDSYPINKQIKKQRLTYYLGFEIFWTVRWGWLGYWSRAVTPCGAVAWRRERRRLAPSTRSTPRSRTRAAVPAHCEPKRENVQLKGVKWVGAPAQTIKCVRDPVLFFSWIDRVKWVPYWVFRLERGDQFTLLVRLRISHWTISLTNS